MNLRHYCMYLYDWSYDVFSDVEFINLQHARASMSSEYHTPNTNRVFSAHYAIDGNENTKPDQCYCCAGASVSPSFWRLNLAKMYSVQGLVFVGRDDGKLLTKQSVASSDSEEQ